MNNWRWWCSLSVGFYNHYYVFMFLFVFCFIHSARMCLTYLIQGKFIDSNLHNIIPICTEQRRCVREKRRASASDRVGCTQSRRKWKRESPDDNGQWHIHTWYYQLTYTHMRAYICYCILSLVLSELLLLLLLRFSFSFAFASELFSFTWNDVIIRSTVSVLIFCACAWRLDLHFFLLLSYELLAQRQTSIQIQRDVNVFWRGSRHTLTLQKL